MTAIPSFQKRKKKKTLKVFTFGDDTFIFNKINPLTDARDGTQYTFGYDIVAQITAFYAAKAGILGKITSMLQRYENGLKTLRTCLTETEPDSRQLMFIIWKEHWLAEFKKIPFPEPGKTYLYNLISTKHKIYIKLLKVRDFEKED